MRKLSLILLLAFLAFSCKSQKSAQKSSSEAAGATTAYSVQKGQTTIKWTAYKKTDKTPVHGTFKADGADAPALVKKSAPAATALGAVNGLEFNVPVMEIFSGNEERDNILRKFFFGLMKNTVQLSGTVHVDATDNSKGSVDLNMNGEQHSFPVTFSVKGDTVNLKGTMDMNNWHIVAAMKSLNDHCKLQHTGADGKSITWSVVDLDVRTVLAKK